MNFRRAKLLGMTLTLLFTAGILPVSYSAGAPIVSTSSVTGIGSNNVTFNGTVDPQGTNTLYWFEYGTSYSLGSTAGNQFIGSGGGFQNVSYYLSGLDYNTLYYYRVVAQNQYGTVQGQILSFTTNYGGGGGSGQYPIATTNYVSNFSQNSATLTGTVNPNGASVSYWFEYGLNAGLGQTTGFQYLGSSYGAQNVTAQLYNLNSNTNYYYRFVVQSSYGTAYGSMYNFTTQGGGSSGNCSSGYGYSNQPCAQTGNPSNIGDTYVTFNGIVTPNGLDATAWFEYGANNYSFNYTTNNVIIPAYSNNYNFSSNVTGLTPGSTYYVRVAARNQSGVSYGQPYQFYTTGSGGGGGVFGQTTIVTTKLATNVFARSAILNGFVNPRGDSGVVWFEYGPTVSMGTKVNPKPFSSGMNSVNVVWTVGGLSSATSYYYRLGAQTSAGVVYGAILTFTTGAGVVSPSYIAPAPQTPVAPAKSEDITQPAGDETVSGQASLLSVFSNSLFSWLVILLLLLILFFEAHHFFTNKKEKEKTSREKIEQTIIS